MFLTVNNDLIEIDTTRPVPFAWKQFPGNCDGYFRIIYNNPNENADEALLTANGPTATELVLEPASQTSSSIAGMLFVFFTTKKDSCFTWN